MNACVIVVFAAIELLSPKQGEVVAVVPDCQKAVAAKETVAERMAMLPSLKQGGIWREIRPVEFRWKASETNEKPWAFFLADNPAMSNACVQLVRTMKGKEGTFSAVPYYQNYIPGRTYYWRVSFRGNVCAAGKRPIETSAVRSFVIEDVAPRWIKIEGTAGNIRDLGGRRTADGRRVRYGLLFRGQGLNDNSADDVTPGRNRLTVEDLAFLKWTLGIRTDLDLRGTRETANMTVSPLGADVKYIQRSTSSYGGIFKETAHATMCSNFRDLCDERNLPLYFHCIGGADRTGALGYIVNGVLGVSKRELEVDWEQTYYPNNPHHPGHTTDELYAGFMKFGADGDTLQRRIELYLFAGGVTQNEIDTFRRIMLESK